MIDQVRKYWDNRPCNIRHSHETIGTKKYFEQVTAKKYFVEPHILSFAQFDRWEGKKVLEIGCGIGTDTISFAQAGAEVTAIDLSGKSIELARKRAKVYGLSHHIKFYEGNAEELTKIVPIENYDLVYSFGVIHHSPNPRKIIEEITSYVDENSLIKIMVYHRMSWKVFMILMRSKLPFKIDRAVAMYSEAQQGCPVTYTYTKKSVKELLKGFDVINVRVEHIFSYLISDYKQNRYVKTWYFRWIPNWLFHSLERRFGWHLCVTARKKT